MQDVELKPQRYKDERPKEYFDEFHARVRAQEPEGKVYEVVRVLTSCTRSLCFAPGASAASGCPADR